MFHFLVPDSRAIVACVIISTYDLFLAQFFPPDLSWKLIAIRLLLSSSVKMSNQRKKNFHIEAFKHRVVVDPKYAEKTWKILEHAIHEIYNHNASGLSFEELYRLSLSSLLLVSFKLL